MAQPTLNQGEFNILKMQQNSLSANISYFNILGVRECENIGLTRLKQTETIYIILWLEQIVVFKL